VTEQFSQLIPDDLGNAVAVATNNKNVVAEAEKALVNLAVVENTSRTDSAAEDEKALLIPAVEVNTSQSDSTSLISKLTCLSPSSRTPSTTYSDSGNSEPERIPKQQETTHKNPPQGQVEELRKRVTYNVVDAEKTISPKTYNGT
jgi:hypothetical protein